jgi:hypothetical protein
MIGLTFTGCSGRLKRLLVLFQVPEKFRAPSSAPGLRAPQIWSTYKLVSYFIELSFWVFTLLLI